MFHFAGALCIICFVWRWQCLTNADDDDDDENDDDYADVMTVMTAVMIKEIQLFILLLQKNVVFFIFFDFVLCQ